MVGRSDRANHIKSDVPPMIDERRQRQAHLADDLRPAVQRFTGLAPRGKRKIRPKLLSRHGAVLGQLTRDAQVLEHVPEKWKPVFRKRTCDRARVKEAQAENGLCPCASSRRGKCRRGHSDAIGRRKSKRLAGCHTPITSRLRPSPPSRYSVARKNGSGSSKDSVDFAWQPIV